MASNRDPRPSYRRRSRKKPTSSATRSKRVKASTAPRPTSSTTRRQQQGKGSNRVTSDKGRTKPVKKNPVSKTPRGAQGPKTPPVQGPRQKVTGIIGTRKGSTKPKNPPTPGSFVKTKSKPSTARGPSTTPKSVVKSATKLKVRGGRGGLAGLAMTALEMAARGGALGKTVKASYEKSDAQMDRLLKNPLKKDTTGSRKKPSSSVGKYNTKDADGTVRSRKKVGPKKVGPKKVGPKKVGTIAQSFDAAFAKARKAGKKTFTFQGKVYNTKTK